MANPVADPRDPRVRQQARELFGDQADVLLKMAERLHPPKVDAAPQPRPDPSQFIQRLAALYMEATPRGEEARETLRAVLHGVMKLISLLDADPYSAPIP